jgi:hypothetical protein
LLGYLSLLNLFDRLHFLPFLLFLRLLPSKTATILELPLSHHFTEGRFHLPGRSRIGGAITGGSVAIKAPKTTLEGTHMSTNKFEKQTLS